MTPSTGAQAIGIGYVRKSTDDQAQSIGLQQTSIERNARERGYKIVAWFKDEGISGTISMDQRPGGRKLFEYLSAHPQVSAVFFDDITRMERSADLHCYSHRLYEFHSKYKVIAYFCSDGVQSNSPQMSDFLICVIKGLESSEFSKKLAFKTARGQIAIVEKGYLSGRQAPYGMDRLLIDVDGRPLSRWVVLNDGSLQKFNIEGTKALDDPIPSIIKQRHETDQCYHTPVDIRVTEPIPKTKNQRVTLIVGRDNAKVETVRYIFETYVNSSIGLRGIAAELNQRGVPPPCTNGGGKRRHAKPGQPEFWRVSTLKYIISNPAYMGMIAFNRRRFSKFWRIEKNNQEDAWQQVAQGIITRSGSRKNDNRHWVSAQRADALLIAPELFQRAQQKLAQRSRNRCFLPRDRKTHYLLSGILCCQCGSRMNGYTINRTKTYKNGNTQHFTYRKYACSTNHASGGTHCSHNSVDANALESFILGKIAAYLANIIKPDRIAAKAARIIKNQPAPSSPANAALQTELQQIERNLAGLPPLDTVAPALRGAFEEQQRTWEQRRAALLRQITQNPSNKADLDPARLQAEAQQLLTDLEHDDVHRLREIINRCIAKIRLEFEPVKQGKRTLYQMQRGELTFFGQPERLSPKVDRGGGI